jgi:hypothetical protein
MLGWAMQSRPGLPTRAALHPDGLYLVLKDIGVEELQDPFMQHTVRRLEAREDVTLVETGKLGIVDLAAAPAGIIFHVGRCGSTVLSQALKQLELAVYSEPLPINELLSPPAGARRDVTLALRSLGAAFAAHANGPYVFKLSSWSTLFADVIAEAFPDSPWVFSVRDPVEVGEALLRDPPPWFVGDSPPALHLAGIVDPAAKSASKEEFFARLYAAFCDTIASLDASRGLLVRYEDLAASLQRVAEHFGVRPDAAQLERMFASASRYAKAPPQQQISFTPDAVVKQAAASPELHAAIDALARPPLARVLRKLGG